MTKKSIFKKKDIVKLEYYNPEGTPFEEELVEVKKPVRKKEPRIEREPKKKPSNNVKAADEGVPFYDEENLEEYYKRKHPFLDKYLKYMIPGIVVLLLIPVIIYFVGYSFSVGTLYDVSLNIPRIIYMGETTSIEARSEGEGNLSRVSYNYEVSDNSLVTLETRSGRGRSNNNNLTPVATGKFTITVRATLPGSDNRETKEACIICKKLTPAVLQSSNITIAKDKKTEVSIDLGTEKDCYKGIEYKISDTKIATIDRNGVITGIKAGETTLTITNAQGNITSKIIVSDGSVALKGIDVNKKETTIQVGSTEALKVTFDPSNATNKGLDYVSSDKQIVTVDNKGVIKGVGSGTAKITITSKEKGFQVEVKVTVEKKAGGNSNGNNSKEPKIINSTMTSTNPVNNGFARVGDKIVLIVTFNEQISNKPDIEIAGIKATVTGTGKSITGSIILPKGKNDGAVSIRISNYKNAAGVTGPVVTFLTGGNQSTIIDNTKPTCTLKADGRKLTINGDDKYGITGYVINKDSKTPTTGFINEKTQTVTSAGTYYGYVRDKAGNVGQCTVKVN